MAKVIPAFRFTDELENDPFTDVTVSMGNDEEWRGALVLRQGTDTIAVAPEAAKAFAEALLKYVNPDG